jgi:exopolyphosphatase/guanosine-5'-triphosphate,3'-diphosphate pyrophosphatase
MRIAIVDVGTNTTRLYIAEVEREPGTARGRVDRELVRISRVTRLGAGVDQTGRLADDALARELAVLDDYAATIAEHAVERRVAVMTSAVRDAANGREFAAVVAARHGLEVHVLSGDDEARLTYLGATDELEDDEHTTLVVDIGGGSTELVVGHGATVDFHVSTQAGVVRQSDRHIAGDPPTDAELDEVALDVRGVLEQAVPAAWRVGVARALAVAGTPTSLAAIAQRLDPYDPSRVHGFHLTAACRDELQAQLAALPLARRREVVGLHPDRAPTIVPGVVILREVMDLFGLAEVEVSEHDILRGAALFYALSTGSA